MDAELYNSFILVWTSVTGEHWSRHLNPTELQVQPMTNAVAEMASC